MRWMLAGMMAMAVGCGVEGADVQQADAEQAMFKTSKVNTTVISNLRDCNKIPDKWHEDCDEDGPDDKNFGTTIGGDPNVVPSDGTYKEYELTTGTVFATQGRDGTIEVSFDRGETISAIIEGAGDFDEITFNEHIYVDDDENGTLAGVSIALSSKDGALMKSGEIGAFSAEAGGTR